MQYLCSTGARPRCALGVGYRVQSVPPAAALLRFEVATGLPSAQVGYLRRGRYNKGKRVGKAVMLQAVRLPCTLQQHIALLKFPPFS